VGEPLRLASALALVAVLHDDDAEEAGATLGERAYCGAR